MIYNDPVWAHEKIFKRRHPDATPVFHGEIVRAFHDPAIIRLLVLAFRGGGKSTIAEETISLQASCKLFRNCVILCENQDRAKDRLTAIKYELMTNDDLNKIFGDPRGAVWGEAKIVMRNGVVIQAFGRGNEVRGMKHLDMRPDYLFCDDLEAKEHVRTPEARFETVRWLFSEVIPACDKLVRIRMDATPLDRESLPMTLLRDKKWKSLVFPVKYKDQSTGEWRSIWPARFPMEKIDDTERDFQSKGLSHDFAREFMCMPEDPSRKVFTEGMFQVVPRMHVWQPAFMAYDPARTTTERSSTTGWAVWSWIANRLVVWDGGAALWRPSDLSRHLFDTFLAYRPVYVGVEEDGLNDWLKEPLRNEMLRRGLVVPIKPMKAPQGKRSFIEGLQPFFSAKAVEFAKDLPELRAQFLNYPTGKIDGPNALAYAIKMRPGVPIYEDFAAHHVVEDCPVWSDVPCWLVFSATPSYTCGILAQFCDGDVHVIRDWVKEGDPGANVHDIYNNARLEIGDVVLRCVIGPEHFTDYDTVGLRPSIGRIPARAIQGAGRDTGRDRLRLLLGQQRRGSPRVSIGHAAHWTINGLSAGYARSVDKHGQISAEPEPGPYSILMGGFESFVGLLAVGGVEDDRAQNIAYTPGGRPYKSILPDAGERHETKEDWLTGNIGKVTGVEHFPKSLIRRPR